MTDAHGVARDQLRAFIERIERLEEEKKTIADDIKDVYGEAKGTGFDTVIMKRVISLRKKDEQKRLEEEAILDTYLAALGMLAQHDLFEPEPVAPVTNKPAMALQSPRQAAEAVSERAAFTSATIAPVLVEADEAEAEATIEGQPSATVALTVQHDGVNVGGLERAGVTAGETATQFHAKASDDACEAGRKALGRAEASADAPDGAELVSRGVGDRAPTATSEEMDVTGGESAATDQPLTGGDHVEREPSAATHQAGGLVCNPPANPLRPHCLRPENCGGYGSQHCFSCSRTAKANEDEEEPA
jgi:uncharacterized protein (UPF0335 family)